MLFGQKATRLAACLMNGFPLDYRVRPGEINKFKYASVGLSFTMGANTAHPVFIHYYDFSRFYIPDKYRSDAVQRTGFGSKNNLALRQTAHAQRPKAGSIPGSDEFLR